MRISGDIVARKVGDSGIIVKIKSNKLFEVNETGFFIWQGLEKNQCYRKIIESLMEEFGIDERKAKKDVDEFFNELCKRDLISLD